MSKIDVTLHVHAIMDESITDVQYVIEEMEDYIRDTLELEYSPDIEFEVELYDVEDYNA